MGNWVRFFEVALKTKDLLAPFSVFELRGNTPGEQTAAVSLFLEASTAPKWFGGP
jgi:hypothetical protein